MTYQKKYISNSRLELNWSWIGPELELLRPYIKKRTRFFRFPFALPPLFLLSKLGEALIPHRLWYGGTTDLERRYNGGKYTTQENCNVEIAFPISKNRIFKLLCNSSPIALQVVVTLIVTAVIHFNTLVTHSSPRHRILY